MANIRIALAEDHQVVADALATMLSLEGGLQVEAVVTSGESIVRLAEEHSPDVILMDVGLEDMSGIEATRLILERDPDARVLMLSMHDDGETVSRAMASGALGFVPKNAARHTLVRAVRAVAEGQGYLDPAITRPFLDRLASGNGTAPHASLTEQEHRVLEQLAHGKSTKCIAGALHMSDETVKTHLRHIYQKLNVHDRVQAVVIALRSGLVH